MTQTGTVMPTPNADKVLDKNVVDISKGENLKIMYNAATAGVIVKIKGYNLTGEMIRSMEFTAACTGWNSVEWDMKNDAGRTVSQGIYFIRIEAEGKSVIRKVYVVK